MLIVTPYRDREAHLKLLLYKLHPFLQAQNLDYCIIVSEQFDGGLFNTGILKNAGFKEGVKLPHFTDRGLEANCLIINDVDLLPENDMNAYLCPDKYAVHLSDRIDKMEYRSHSGGSLGGVAMIPRDTYEIANGHSNLFWGWGGEDGDMGWRVHYSMGGNYLLFPHSGIGRFQMMEHLHPWTNFPRPPAGDNVIDVMNDYVAASTGVLKVHRTLRQRYDGLNTVRYNILKKENLGTHTHIMNEIRKMSLEEFTHKIDGKIVMHRYPDQDIRDKKECTLIKFEKVCAVEDKNLNSQYTADKVNCTDSVDWCDEYKDKCLGVFYNGEQDHVDTVLFKKEMRMKKRDKEVSFNKYNSKSKMGIAERMYIKTDNYTDETQSDSYIEWQLGTTCSINLIPHPLATCEKQDHKTFAYVKDCPGKQGLFQVLDTPVYLDFGTKGKDIKIELEFKGRLLQPFDGLVTYRDTILWEGRRISSANLQVNDLVPNLSKMEDIEDKSHSEVHGAATQHTVNVSRPTEDENFVVVKITFTLKQALPGFYSFNCKLMDDFFQPYVEFNTVMRIQGGKQAQDSDTKMRKKYSNQVKYDTSKIDNKIFVDWRDRARKNLLAFRRIQLNKTNDCYHDPIPIQQAKLDATEDDEVEQEIQGRLLDDKLRKRAKIKAQREGLDVEDDSVIEEQLRILKERHNTESDADTENAEKRLSAVNWRFKNIEEGHAGRWLNDAVRMLDEIVDHQSDQMDLFSKNIKKH